MSDKKTPRVPCWHWLVLLIGLAVSVVFVVIPQALPPWLDIHVHWFTPAIGFGLLGVALCRARKFPRKPANDASQEDRTVRSLSWYLQWSGILWYFLSNELIFAAGHFFREWAVAGEKKSDAFVYESISILGVGTTLSVAILAFFIPSLLNLWNEFIRGFDTSTIEICQLLANKELRVKRERAKNALKNAIKQRTDVGKLGDGYRKVFYASIGVSAFLLVGNGIGFVVFYCPRLAYGLAALAGVVAVAQLLWFLTLMAYFVIEIHPIARIYEEERRTLILEGNACDT